MQKQTVTTQQATKRLDLALTLLFPNFSRTAVRKLLDSGKVTLNGEVEYRPNYKVNEGDVLMIESAADMERKRLPEYKKEVEIVYRDKDIVIVNKPSGLIVHPTSIENQKSLLNAMYYMLRDDLTEYGVNLVNRIDKDTSGLVVLAISPEGAWHYAKQFAEGLANKTYLAAVSRKWHYEDELRASNFLKYNHVEKRQYIDKNEGEHAETIFKFVKYDQERKISIVEAKPITGRTHQIRVQLENLGFPIIGDKKYNGEPAERLMLHAYQIKLTGLDGKEIKATATPPEFLQ